MKEIHLAKTVFLAGTNTLFDVYHTLYKALQKMGYTPLWFREPSFPQGHATNAMDVCLVLYDSPT
jgi:hypothetical protein